MLLSVTMSLYICADSSYVESYVSIIVSWYHEEKKTKKNKTNQKTNKKEDDDDEKDEEDEEDEEDDFVL